MHTANHLQRVMEIIGDETRFKIFEIMLEGGNLCVTEISSLLGISASATSQHFRMLELAGLVTKERDGQKICYQPMLEDPVVSSIANLIRHHQQHKITV